MMKILVIICALASLASASLLRGKTHIWRDDGSIIIHTDINKHVTILKPMDSSHDTTDIDDDDDSEMDHDLKHLGASAPIEREAIPWLRKTKEIPTMNWMMPSTQNKMETSDMVHGPWLNKNSRMMNWMTPETPKMSDSSEMQKLLWLRMNKDLTDMNLRANSNRNMEDLLEMNQMPWTRTSWRSTPQNMPETPKMADSEIQKLLWLRMNKDLTNMNLRANSNQNMEDLLEMNRMPWTRTSWRSTPQNMPETPKMVSSSEMQKLPWWRMNKYSTDMNLMGHSNQNMEDMSQMPWTRMSWRPTPQNMLATRSMMTGMTPETPKLIDSSEMQKLPWLRMNKDSTDMNLMGHSNQNMEDLTQMPWTRMSWRPTPQNMLESRSMMTGLTPETPKMVDDYELHKLPWLRTNKDFTDMNLGANSNQNMEDMSQMPWTRMSWRPTSQNMLETNSMITPAIQNTPWITTPRMIQTPADMMTIQEIPQMEQMPWWMMHKKTPSMDWMLQKSMKWGGMNNMPWWMMMKKKPMMSSTVGRPMFMMNKKVPMMNMMLEKNQQYW